MKIAIDCRVLKNKNWAGKEQVLISILRNIVDNDNENEYVLYFEEYDKDRLKISDSYKIKIFKLPTPFGNLEYCLILYLKKLI